ncbi:MAG: hypothetical protein ACREID_04250 [Planctomycetota bacterium]
MSDPRLRRKIEETQRIAAQRGLDLAAAPLVAVFELPLWGEGVAASDVAELGREPGAALAVYSSDPMPEVLVAPKATRLHVIAEGGLACHLSGGAVLHAYPTKDAEFASFAVALFAGVAPEGLRIALHGCVSGGRQLVTLEGEGTGPPATSRELLHAVRRRNGVAEEAADGAILVDDVLANLEALRAALNLDLCKRYVRVTRLPSGSFRLVPDRQPRPVDPERLLAIAHGIAMSCDRILELRGTTLFGFVTEPVARKEYGPERGARRLAEEIFAAPDTVVTYLGLHPFTGEGSLFFAYEGSETVWEAAGKGISYVTVRDLVEYLRVLLGIRRKE